MKLNESDKVRFWNKVSIGEEHECWEWNASLRSGYGTFRLNGKMMYAHRIAYEIENGKIPDHDSYHGMCVRHTCDNRKCCNPKHLELGSHQENMNDKVERDRQPRGESHTSSKLSDEQVLEIKSLYRTGNYYQQQLADMFGVSQVLISYIVNDKRWNHI